MEVILDGAPHVLLADAARELQTTPLRILMLIKRKVMKGVQVDGEWYVDTTTFGCFQSHDTADGKSVGCSSGCSGCSGH